MVDQESYGECVVALQPLLTGIEQTLDVPLTHRGVETGTLTLQWLLILPTESTYMQNNEGKVYELISVSEEDVRSSSSAPSTPDVLSTDESVSTLVCVYLCECLCECVCMFVVCVCLLCVCVCVCVCVVCVCVCVCVLSRA